MERKNEDEEKFVGFSKTFDELFTHCRRARGLNNCGMAVGRGVGGLGPTPGAGSRARSLVHTKGHECEWFTLEISLSKVNEG